MNTEHIEIEQEEQPQVEIQQQEPVVNNVEKNWKHANEVMNLQKKRIEELEQRVSSFSIQTQAPEDTDDLDDSDPEDYVTVAKAKELAQKLATKAAKEAARTVVEEYAQTQALSSDEQRMRSKFDDYDFVIENFALPAIQQDPALAYKVKMSKNPAETAYKLGKLSDKYEESVPKQTNPKVEKILKNTSRPSSAFAAGSSLKTQVDQASSMTPAQIWEMSQKYSKGA
jgi:hypothetical protein